MSVCQCHVVHSTCMFNSSETRIFFFLMYTYMFPKNTTRSFSHSSNPRRQIVLYCSGTSTRSPTPRVSNQFSSCLECQIVCSTSCWWCGVQFLAYCDPIQYYMSPQDMVSFLYATQTFCLYLFLKILDSYYLVQVDHFQD